MKESGGVTRFREFRILDLGNIFGDFRNKNTVIPDLRDIARVDAFLDLREDTDRQCEGRNRF